MATRKPAPLEFDRLLDYAVRALASRAYSTGEIREKLRRRAARATDIDAVLSRLKELNYLNDARFAQSFAQSRLRNEGVGRVKVERDLRRRRVAPALAGKAAAEAYSGTDEAALVRAWIERKYRGKDLAAFLAVEKNLASAFRRLRGAGFSASASISTLKQFASRAGELEDWDPAANEQEPEG